MTAPISLVDLDPDFLCSPSRSQWLREFRVNIPWTQAHLARACGVARSTVVRWENDQSPVPKTAIVLVLLANIINEYCGISMQVMNWPERERDRWRRYLSTQNHPVDVVACAELRELLDVPDPVMPTKEEMERKYKRQAGTKGKRKGAPLVKIPIGRRSCNTGMTQQLPDCFNVFRRFLNCTELGLSMH